MLLRVNNTRHKIVEMSVVLVADFMSDQWRVLFNIKIAIFLKQRFLVTTLGKHETIYLKSFATAPLEWVK